MKTIENMIDPKTLQEDEMILAYLKGEMSEDKDATFFEELKNNEKLKERAITMARLTRGMKDVGTIQDKIIMTAMLSSSKKDIISIASRASRSNGHEMPAETHKKPKPFIRKASIWMSIAASFALIICSGISLYNYQYNMRLADEYANAFGSSQISRGGDDNTATEAKLARLFDNIAKKKDLDNTIHELALCWELSTMETYNDYTDYSAEIGWNLAIGYLKDNDKKNAKIILEELVSKQPNNSFISLKSIELLRKLCSK